MDYQEAWQYLDRLQFFKIKLGLAAMTRLLDRLGRPQDRLAFVHIGGTNGKGSVAVTLQALLTRAGYRVGLYTSPHLSSVRERFRIDGHYIPEDAFARHIAEIRAVLGTQEITYFECATALALLWFAAQEVDLAILEVGMGGRLDATNVVTPLAAAITNVSLDHQAYLGETVRAIAHEKAGIVKPGVPVVTGATGEALAVIEDRCREVGAPLHRLGTEFAMEGTPERCWYRPLNASGRRGPYSLGLAGDHQLANTGVALALAEILAGRGFRVTEEAVAAALPAVRWPGRLETAVARYNGGPAREFVLDGAHNPAGVAALAAALGRYQRRGKGIVLLWAAMADKDLHQGLPCLAPLARHLVVCGMPYQRAATPEQLLACLPAGHPPADQAADPAAGLARAVAVAGEDDVILVSGSLYLVGAVRRLLVGEVA